MSTWIKLHSSINHSSIKNCAYHTRLVWMSLMALCDLDGIAYISESCVASTANVLPHEAEEAIKTLMAPDPNSKDPEFEGRRMEKVRGGFRLLNYFKYRAIHSPAHRSEYMKEYMRDYREKKKREKDCLTWQEVYQNEANDAFMIPIPAHFPPEVESAVNDFISLRMEKATTGQRKQDRVRFSPAMVKSLFNETEIALDSSSPQAVAKRLREAATSGYKSPRFKGFYDS